MSPQGQAVLEEPHPNANLIKALRADAVQLRKAAQAVERVHAPLKQMNKSVVTPRLPAQSRSVAVGSMSVQLLHPPSWRPVCDMTHTEPSGHLSAVLVLSSCPKN